MFTHEYIDAADLAEWEVDYLKYDFCYHTGTLAGVYFIAVWVWPCELRQRYSVGFPGNGRNEKWIKTTGAHMAFDTHIQNSWASIRSITHQ